MLAILSHGAVNDPGEKGEEDMTKTEARKRAKARAAQKAVKPEPDPNRPDQKIQAGRFDPGTSSIKGPRENINAKSFAEAKRGAARSR